MSLGMVILLFKESIDYLVRIICVINNTLLNKAIILPVTLKSLLPDQEFLHLHYEDELFSLHFDK